MFLIAVSRFVHIITSGGDGAAFSQHNHTVVCIVIAFVIKNAGDHRAVIFRSLHIQIKQISLGQWFDLRNSGFRLILEDGSEEHAPTARAVQHMAEAGPQDVVLVTTKAHQLRELEARLASGDVQLTAPQWGRGRLASQGAAAEFELAVLAPYAEWCDGLEKAGLDQDRRPLLLKPEQMSWQQDGEVLTLSFFLPAGAFATSVVRELMQAEEADHGFRNPTDANSGQ